MALTETYFVQVKNVGDIFSSLLNAQAPEIFTQKFLNDLGYTSINDRPFITVLRALKFLDDTGVPTQRYYDYLDEENSKKILAQGIRDAYADLFAVNQKAYELKNDQVKSKLKSLLQGKKSEAVLIKMAATFTTLCSLADFTGIPKSMEKEKVIDEIIPTENIQTNFSSNDNIKSDLSLKYSINIELPSTRDKLVYDAIFKSIRENLL